LAPPTTRNAIGWSASRQGTSRACGAAARRGPVRPTARYGFLKRNFPKSEGGTTVHGYRRSNSEGQAFRTVHYLGDCAPDPTHPWPTGNLRRLPARNRRRNHKGPGPAGPGQHRRKRLRHLTATETTRGNCWSRSKAAHTDLPVNRRNEATRIRIRGQRNRVATQRQRAERQSQRFLLTGPPHHLFSRKAG